MPSKSLANPIRCNNFHTTNKNRNQKFKSATYYYDVLHITPKATNKQIKAAFYRLSKLHHPDANIETGSIEKFHEISEAYEVLGNHFSRRKYDRGLIRPEQRTATAENEGNQETAFKPGAFKARGPIQTGRTKYYNFDEYYKQHYGDCVKQQFQKRHGKEVASKAEPKEEIHDYTHLVEDPIMGRIFVGLGLTLMAVYICIAANPSVTKRLEETPKSK